MLWYLVLVLFVLVSGTDEARDKTMDGRHFRSAVFEQPTAIKFIRNSTGSVIGYSGINYEIFQWLSERLNFTYTLVPVSQYAQGQLPNGSWIGVHELIRRKVLPLFQLEVDFISCGVLLINSALTIMDFTATTAEIPVAIMAPPPAEESRFRAPIKPFTLEVWLSITGSVIVVCISFYVIYKLEGRISHSQHSPSMTEIATILAGVTFGQIEFPVKLSRTLVIRVIEGVFCLTALVIVNSYTSTFISFATTPKLVPVVEDVFDLAYRSNLRYIGVRTQNIAIFTNSSIEAMRICGEQLKNPQNLYPSFALAAEKVTTGCCAFLFPRNVLESWLSDDVKKTGKCRCAITQKAEFWDYYAFAGQKGNPEVKILAKEILVAKQMGLFDYWWRSEPKKAERCLKQGKSQVRPLKFYDLSGVFLLFAAGICLSFLVFIIEIGHGKFKNVKRAKTKVQVKP